jgi:hypothetical protein
MAQPQSHSQLPLLVRIVGRVDFVKQGTSKGKPSFLTLVKTPAPDPFTAPSTVEVRSSARLGSVGEEVEVFANLKGYSQSGVSQKTGEAYRRAQNVLEAVAA